MKVRDLVRLLVFLQEVERESILGSKRKVFAKVNGQVWVSVGRKEKGKVVRITTVDGKPVSLPELQRMKEEVRRRVLSQTNPEPYESENLKVEVEDETLKMTVYADGSVRSVRVASEENLRKLLVNAESVKLWGKAYPMRTPKVELFGGRKACGVLRIPETGEEVELSKEMW